MAIGLDTSVVLRLLIGEPRAQADVARRRIERALVAGEKVVVTDLVVAEVFHALRHHYDVPQTMARSRLQSSSAPASCRWIRSEPRKPWGKEQEDMPASSTA